MGEPQEQEQEQPQEQEEQQGKQPPEPPESVIVRSPAKIIFMYPTFLVAIICGIWTALALPGGEPMTMDQLMDELPLGPGRLFWCVFVFNLLVLAFDFSRGHFVALVLIFVVLVLGTVLLSQNFDFLGPVQTVLAQVKLFAHPHFYFLFSLALGAMFLGLFIYMRFDYWEITHNEVRHHHGFMGNEDRWPAPDLSMSKEITDVFEFVLLGAGRLVIHPQGSARPVILENVLFVGSKEKYIQHMLSTLSVTVRSED